MEKEKPKKEEYEKPKIIKLEKMNFPTDIIESTSKGGRVCRQCSSCHNCR